MISSGQPDGQPRYPSGRQFGRQLVLMVTNYLGVTAIFTFALGLSIASVTAISVPNLYRAGSFKHGKIVGVVKIRDRDTSFKLVALGMTLRAACFFEELRHRVVQWHPFRPTVLADRPHIGDFRCRSRHDEALLEFNMINLYVDGLALEHGSLNRQLTLLLPREGP